MTQLFQQLNPQSSNVQSPLLNSLKQKYQQLKMMTNPIGYINNMPEMKNVMEMVNNNGGNAKDVFYKLAEQKGVNPDDIFYGR